MAASRKSSHVSPKTSIESAQAPAEPGEKCQTEQFPQRRAGRRHPLRKTGVVTRSRYQPISSAEIQVLPEESGERLDTFLRRRLSQTWQSPVSRNQVKALLNWGKVHLNRKVMRLAAKPLAAYSLIRVLATHEDLQRWQSDSSQNLIEIKPDWVLFEDPQLIALNKPPHVPTQGTLDPTRDHLFAAAQRFLKARSGGSTSPYVGLHHRLDRDTSGIVLMTKKRVVNKSVAELFANRKISKIYLALIETPEKQLPPDRWEVKNHLAKVGSPQFTIRSVHAGGLFAHTDFRVLKRFSGYTLVAARPHTGRTHQIRVHLAEAGWPIVGDSFYGRGPCPQSLALRTLLHAHQLHFPHPLHDKWTTIVAPLPDDFTHAMALLTGCSLGPEWIAMALNPDDLQPKNLPARP